MIFDVIPMFDIKQKFKGLATMAIFTFGGTLYTKCKIHEQDVVAKEDIS